MPTDTPLPRRRLLGGLVAAGLAVSSRPATAWATTIACDQSWPFVRRRDWLDVGVPVDPDGDPGSGSFGSAPFGLTNELGIVFEARRDFMIGGASIAEGVSGAGRGGSGGLVRNTLTAFELAPGTADRVATLATATALSLGTIPLVLFSRVYGINPWKVGGPTYWWFDTPLTARFSAGKRYELVFSNFTVVSGTTWNGPNWLYAHPLYDPAEERGYGRPYDVCDLLTVVDGSLRGSRIIGLPMMLIRPRPERFLGGPAGEVEEFLSYTAPFEAVTTVAPGATSYDLPVVYGASIRPTTFRSALNGRPFAGFTPVPGGTETVAIPLRAGTNRLRLTVDGTVARGWKATDSDDLTFVVPSMP